ncbi:hypothetical protein X758_18110 [Mesorhizobium sp. LSHC416B00]|nr:hypothetical protein X761_12790 [Mesorhizobium sp. LSHC424B00]ESX70541.1 hypothetical protein X758_18110 [Mesorhizobium sp. LSHC416B00]
MQPWGGRVSQRSERDKLTLGAAWADRPPLRQWGFIGWSVSVVWAFAGFTILLPACASAQARPSFCDQVPDSMLTGLQAPYEVRADNAGKPYCEGLLVKPIALVAPRVVSVKQAQPGPNLFPRKATATLSWCDKSGMAVHLSLRSTVVPFFGLDAMEQDPFTWSTDVIAIWQPDWTRLSALATRIDTQQGQTYTVSIPLRVGPGYDNSYAFLIHSQLPTSFNKALIEPVSPAGPPTLVDIVMSGGPSQDTSAVSLTFADYAAGIYRVTFEQTAVGAGLTTQPILLLHQDCGTHG